MPGLFELRASRIAASISSTACRPSGDRTPPGLERLPRQRRHPLGRIHARAANDVRVGGVREQRAETSRRWRRSTTSRRARAALERRRATLEGHARMPSRTHARRRPDRPRGASPRAASRRARSRHPALSARPSPPGAARRIAAYTSRASSTVVSSSTLGAQLAADALVEAGLQTPRFTADRLWPAARAAARCRDSCWSSSSTPSPRSACRMVSPTRLIARRA